MMRELFLEIKLPYINTEVLSQRIWTTTPRDTVNQESKL